MLVHLTNSSMHSEEGMANNILTFCGEVCKVGVGSVSDKTSTIKNGCRGFTFKSQYPNMAQNQHLISALSPTVSV